MIELKNVTKTYGGDFAALEDITLQIKDGEFVFIVGGSGSGKSTLARLLIREEKPTSGTIEVDGQDLGTMKRRKVPYYRRKLGIIFQDFRLFPEKTVYENVAFALRVLGEHSAGLRMKVSAALKLVELSDKAKAYPDQLSGGELQRVALARALAGGPGILIADEPTGNIDPVQSREFIELLYRIHSRYQKTVVVLTHEKELAAEFGLRTVTLSRGKLEEDRLSAFSGSTVFATDDSVVGDPANADLSAADTLESVPEENPFDYEPASAKPIKLVEDMVVTADPSAGSEESESVDREETEESVSVEETETDDSGSEEADTPAEDEGEAISDGSASAPSEGSGDGADVPAEEVVQ